MGYQGEVGESEYRHIKYHCVRQLGLQSQGFGPGHSVSMDDVPLQNLNLTGGFQGGFDGSGLLGDVVFQGVVNTGPPVGKGQQPHFNLGHRDSS